MIEMDQKRPNIIVFMLDSLRPDYLGCNGCKIAKTPNIDKLAADGINFINAYSEYPITIPTRTALLAGIYTHTNRTWKPMTEYDLHITEFIKRKGYKTALFGDSPMTTEVNNCHIGFDIFKHSPYGKVQFEVPGANKFLSKINLNDYFWIEEDLEVDRERGDLTLNIEQNIFIKTMANELYLKETQNIRRAAFVTNIVLDWLDSLKNKRAPFFLWIDHFEPHEPWLAEEEFLKPFEYLLDKSSGICPMPPSNAAWVPDGVMKNLLAHVHATNFESDMEVGRVIQKIDDLGLTEDTVFIVISDHGEPYGEHGTIRKFGVPIYEELAKIPFIVKGPGFNRGSIINALLTTPDISGFLLKTAGVRIVRGMESLSLHPAIENEDSGLDVIHDMIFIGAFQVRAGCRTPKWKFIDNRGDKGGKDELYDLINDPVEKNNLIEEEPDIAEALCKDVWQFGRQWARQLAFRDHPSTPWEKIKISKIMGKNYQNLKKERDDL